jgi:hypothetical protein
VRDHGRRAPADPRRVGPLPAPALRESGDAARPAPTATSSPTP